MASAAVAAANRLAINDDEVSDPGRAFVDHWLDALFRSRYLKDVCSVVALAGVHSPMLANPIDVVKRAQQLGTFLANAIREDLSRK